MNFANVESCICVTTVAPQLAASSSAMGKKPKPLLEPVSEDGNSSFARALGSVDYHTRERGLQALTIFLSRKKDIPRLELKKLWKGLFYCFWHADLVHVQVRRQ